MKKDTESSRHWVLDLQCEGRQRHRAEQEVHARARRGPISESSLRFALRHPMICVGVPVPERQASGFGHILPSSFSSLLMQGLEMYHHSPLLLSNLFLEKSCDGAIDRPRSPLRLGSSRPV